MKYLIFLINGNEAFQSDHHPIPSRPRFRPVMASLLLTSFQQLLPASFSFSVGSICNGQANDFSNCLDGGRQFPSPP